MGFKVRSTVNIVAKVADDIDNEGTKRVMQAAKYVRKMIVSSANINVREITGNLHRGVGAEKRMGSDSVHHFNVRSGSKMKGRAYAVVGMTAPAYHAHLLEFGVKPHAQTNAFGKGVITQHPGSKKSPFFEKAIEASKDGVEQILSGQWVS